MNPAPPVTKTRITTSKSVRMFECTLRTKGVRLFGTTTRAFESTFESVRKFERSNVLYAPTARAFEGSNVRPDCRAFLSHNESVRTFEHSNVRTRFVFRRTCGRIPVVFWALRRDWVPGRQFPSRGPEDQGSRRPTRRNNPAKKGQAPATSCLWPR